jgi:activating signal cointegrator complex subunit 3
MGPAAPMESLVGLISQAMEFDELPVRHNEELLNAELSEYLPWPADQSSLDSSHTKTFLLLQAHFYRQPLPISDYINDTKSVLDQVPRVLNALIDISADEGQLPNVLTLMKISQIVVQGLSHDSSELLQLPEVTQEVAARLNASGYRSLEDISRISSDRLSTICESDLSSKGLGLLMSYIKEIPLFRMQLRVKCKDDNDADWIEVNNSTTVELKPNETYILEVAIERTHGRPNAKTYSPRFHKPKVPSWWIVLGSPESGELFALKRIEEIGKSRTSQLEFLVNGREHLSLYLVPDSVMGLEFNIQWIVDANSK